METTEKAQLVVMVNTAQQEPLETRMERCMLAVAADINRRAVKAAEETAQH